jgi:hypothetical protein
MLGDEDEDEQENGNEDEDADADDDSDEEDEEAHGGAAIQQRLDLRNVQSNSIARDKNISKKCRGR